MNQFDRLKEILATYEKHGWQVRRALLRPETRALIPDNSWAPDVTVDPDFDALWFSRPSHQGREAWELRLVAEAQYALFETFEADEPEAAREELRREMEARVRSRVMGDK